MAFEKPDYRIKNNLGYIAQEWSKYVSDTEGAEAGSQVIAQLIARFPTLRNIQRAASGFIDRKAEEAINQGDYKQAIEIYQQARQNSPDDSHLKRNEEATWVSWAKGYMEDKQWDQALDIYEKAHAVHPDTYVFKQNISYIIQEWTRKVSESEGNEAAENLISELAPRFPDISSVQNAGGKNTAREIDKLIKAGQYQQAQTQLKSSREYFSKKTLYDNMVVNLYYHWSNNFSANGNFESAVNIYNDALSNHPSNSRLKNNAIATWHAWAEPYLKGEEWTKAIEIYKDGLLKIPSASLFKNNIRYCQAKLKAQ